MTELSLLDLADVDLTERERVTTRKKVAQKRLLLLRKAADPSRSVYLPPKGFIAYSFFGHDRGRR